MAIWERSGLLASLNTDKVPLDGYSSLKALLLSMLLATLATGSFALDSILRASDCEMGNFRNSKMHSLGLNLFPKTLAEILSQSINSLV